MTTNSSLNDRPRPGSSPVDVHGDDVRTPATEQRDDPKPDDETRFNLPSPG